MTLITVGSLAFDTIETPFGKAEKIVGGAATYITLAASYFHSPIQLVSVIGEDFSPEMWEEFKKRNVNLEGVEIRKGEKSFFWHGKYGMDLNTRDTLVTELNVLANFSPKIPDSYQGSDYLMLGNLDPKVQRSVIEQMKRRPSIIAMDTMNFWIENVRDEVLKTIRQTDILIINDEEARLLAEDHSLARAANKILNMGPKYLVIKKGEHGALLFDKTNVFFAPALPLEEVFDPTGAGDSFAGGLIGYIAKTGKLNFENLKNAVIYGSVIASFCVEEFGPQRLVSLTPLEIRERYKAFTSLTSFNTFHLF